MKRLREALEEERNRQFVGRSEELHLLADWWANEKCGTQVMALFGIGGIGKTSLLLRMLDVCRDKGGMGIWLDGRTCGITPRAFLETVQPFIAGNSNMPALRVDDVGRAFTALAEGNRRIVLCIDNYEAISVLDSWLRDVLFPELPSNGLFIVLASRRRPALEWGITPLWRNRFVEKELQPLTRFEVQAYFGALDIQSLQADLLQKISGHPLTMAVTAAQAMRETPRVRSPQFVNMKLLSEEVPTSLQEAIDVLCIVPNATHSLFNELLQSPLSIKDFHALASLSFVRPSPHGLALHDIAREVLIRDFQIRSEADFRFMQRRVAKRLAQSMSGLPVAERRAMMENLLMICRDRFVDNDFVACLSPASGSISTDSVRNEDIPKLLQFMLDMPGQSLPISSVKLSAFLDDLLSHVPHSIQVLRTDSGEAVGCFAGFLLYKDTAMLLDRHIPNAVSRCLPKEAKHIYEIDEEETDTYLHLFGAPNARHPHYSVDELQGILLMEAFPRVVSSGMRTLFLTGEPNYWSFFRRLGFNKRVLPKDTEDDAHGGAWEGELYQLDFRKFDALSWVIGMLDDDSHDYNRHLNGDFIFKGLLEALQWIASPEQLGKTKLALHFKKSGEDLQRTLQALISEPSNRFSDYDRELFATIVRFPKQPSAAATFMNASRSTYFRHRRIAIENLSSLLFEQIQS